MSNTKSELGTKVLSSELYEFPHHNDTAVCVECETEIDVPAMDDPNADMKEPHWRHKSHFEPCDDVFEALCDSCYAQAVSDIIGGESDA